MSLRKVVTLEGQHVHPLQAVPARRGEAAPFGQAALPAGQHGSRRDDARGGDPPHPLIELLNLRLLGRLQSQDLRQVSEEHQRKQDEQLFENRHLNEK